MVPVCTDIAYMNMLNITELAYTTCPEGQLFNKQHAQIGKLWQKLYKHTYIMKINGVLCSETMGAINLEVCKIIDRIIIFFYLSDIW